MKKEYLKVKIEELIPYEFNNKKHSKKQIDLIVNSIKETGYIAPIVIDEDNIILAGHGRYEALKKLGEKEVDVVKVYGLTETQKKKYRILDNRIADLAEYDLESLKIELEELGDEKLNELFKDFDINLDIEEEFNLNEEKEDEIPEEDEEIIVQYGDIFKLGDHYLMCGDSTKKEDVEKLMNGEKADIVFTDPPYGMGLENKGVTNDNLYGEKFIEFSKKYINNIVNSLKSNGSFYIWGTDEGLFDIYAEILKPLIKNKVCQFRNELVWNKGVGQGQLSEGFKKYPVLSERCLFFTMGKAVGVDNSDEYWEGGEPIRLYLYNEVKKAGITSTKIKEICGVGMYAHWFTKSQWTFITKDNYKKLQEYCKRKGIKAFEKEYEELKKEYEELKKEYEELRPYFNNTFEKLGDVINIGKTPEEERKEAGGHYTPKPIALCSLCIQASSREGEKVLDLFGGSGSTLIACEKTGRVCYMMEYEPHYIQVIIKRYYNYTNGQKEIKCLNRDLDLSPILNDGK